MIEKSAIEKMMDGYNVTEEKNLEEGQEEDVIQKDNVEERELTPIEKLMYGYDKDGLQKEEAIVDPNNIKEENR